MAGGSKKRKPDAEASASLDAARGLHASFREAANALSAVYAQALGATRGAAAAGARGALVRATGNKIKCFIATI